MAPPRVAVDRRHQRPYPKRLLPHWLLPIMLLCRCRLFVTSLQLSTAPITIPKPFEHIRRVLQRVAGTHSFTPSFASLVDTGALRKMLHHIPFLRRSHKPRGAVNIDSTTGIMSDNCTPSFCDGVPIYTVAAVAPDSVGPTSVCVAYRSFSKQSRGQSGSRK